LIELTTGVNPTNHFSLNNEDFFRFLILSLAILKNRQYFIMLQTLKLTNENRKSEEIEVWYD
jgi:hypothetical protein